MTTQELVQQNKACIRRINVLLSQPQGVDLLYLIPFLPKVGVPKIREGYMYPFPGQGQITTRTSSTCL